MQEPLRIAFRNLEAPAAVEGEIRQRAAELEEFGGRLDKLCVGDAVRYVVQEGEGEQGPQASTVIPL